MNTNRAKILLAWLEGVYEDPKMLKDINNAIDILNGEKKRFDTTKVVTVLEALKGEYSDINIVNSINLAIIKVRRFDIRNNA